MFFLNFWLGSSNGLFLDSWSLLITNALGDTLEKLLLMDLETCLWYCWERSYLLGLGYSLSTVQLGSTEIMDVHQVLRWLTVVLTGTAHQRRNRIGTQWIW